MQSFMIKTIRNMDWILFASLMGLFVVGLFALNIAILSGLMHAYMILRPLISYNEMALIFMMTAMGLVTRIAIESKQGADSNRKLIR